MKLKSMIGKLGIALGAMIMAVVAGISVFNMSVTADAAIPAASTFDGAAWKNNGDVTMLPQDGVISVAQNTAAYNASPIGTYDEVSKTYTVSVEVSFNMETYNANHTQIFITPSIENYATTINGKFGKAGSTLLGTRAYYADAAAHTNGKMLLRITDYANWRTNVAFEGITHDDSSKHVFTWIITETAVTMQFDGTDLCASGSTPYALLKSDGVAWTLADFMDNGTPKAYFGTYNTAWTPLEIHNAGETPVVEKEEVAEFESNTMHLWSGALLYPDNENRMNGNLYSSQNIAMDYDKDAKTMKTSVEMSFAKTSYSTGQLTIWVSPMVISDWNAEVNGGLGKAGGKLLALKIYYQNENGYNGNRILVRIWDYSTWRTSDYFTVAPNDGSKYIISWSFTESGVTMQFDGTTLGKGYQFEKAAGSVWTINDFIGASGEPQAYFGMMNNAGFGNAYLHNVNKSECKKVTFNADNGTNATVKEVYTGTPVAAITAPTKQSTDPAYSYTFDAWYNGETAYDFNANVTEDITLIAKYNKTPIDYTATVVKADGSSTEVVFNSTNKAEKLAEIAAMKNTDDAAYTYSWATALPTELPYEDVTYTVVKTPVEYTATVVKADGTSAEVKFNVENRVEKLASVAEMKTANDAAYTYAWTEALPEELPLENVTYTFNKTAVEYTATVEKADGTQVEVKYTIENRAEKLAEIAAMKPVNDANYTYYWAVALPAELPLENATYKVVKAGEKYVATVVAVDGTETEFEFTVDTRAAQLAEIAKMKPADTTEYVYTWKNGLPAELPLQNETYTIVKTPVEYTATVVKADGTNEEVNFNVENKAEKLTVIAAMKPADAADYTYAWATALPEMLALENVTFTVTKTPVEYTATVVKADGTNEEVTFNVENKAERLTAIAAMKPADAADYTYAWATALPETLALENAMFTVTKTPVEYTATVVKADGTNAKVKFNVENKAEKLAEIAAMKSADNAEYAYEWAEALPEALTLENATFTEVKTPVEYTAMVVKADGTEVEVAYTVENRGAKLEEIAAMRPKNDAEFTYGWSEALPVELPLENGKTYTVTKMAVELETPDEPKDEPETPDESTTEDSSVIDKITGMVGNKLGCGGTVFGLGATITILGAAVVVLLKKKED